MKQEQKILVAAKSTELLNNMMNIVEEYTGRVNGCRAVNSIYDLAEVFENVMPDVILTDKFFRYHMENDIALLNKLKPCYIILISESRQDCYIDALEANTQAFYNPEYGPIVLLIYWIRLFIIVN